MLVLDSEAAGSRAGGRLSFCHRRILKGSTVALDITFLF